MSWDNQGAVRRGYLYRELWELLDKSDTIRDTELVRLTKLHGRTEVEWILNVIKEDIDALQRM